ncbi:MAG: RluA family pseudouridine synthase [Planctomycetota bacterium]
MPVNGETGNTAITVPEEQTGNRLDKFLSQALYPRYSRSYLTGLIHSGHVWVNGKGVAASHRLRAGDRVEVELGERTSDSPGPEVIPLQVLFEDSAIVVINKGAGLMAHPGPATRRGTLVNALLHRYPEVRGVGVAERPGLVHRLDRDTSGVMVVARTNSARDKLVAQFKGRTVKKEYRAIVVGEPRFDSDYIDLPIGQDPRYGDRMRVDLRQGKPASSFYEVIERFSGFSFLGVSLFTGRTHQIRVHLSHIGFPIVGDSVYGRRGMAAYQKLRDRLEHARRTVPALNRQALHSHRLVFEHPLSGKVMDFTAPLPEDMAELLDILRELERHPL